MVLLLYLVLTFIKAIKERIQSLDFQDCKVRVTNVDSQGSEDNIVIQVIGEMSNKSQPHRKFVQTFVLAGQTNGYFVLNDIFRYIREDEEEEVAPEVSEPDPVPSGYKEPAPTASDSALKSLDDTKETVAHEPDVAEVDKKLEEVAHEEEEEAKETAPPAQVNGTPVPEVAEVIPTEEAPAAAVSTPEEQAVEEAPIPVAEEPVQTEKPKAPAPTPAPAKAAPPPVVAAAPPKPAVPKTWAQLVTIKTAPVASAPAPAQPTATQPKAAAPTPAATQSTPAAASTPAPPVRQPSPAGSQQEGSSGGWQTAGAEHSRSKSRAQAPIVGPDGKVRAYVKNVYAGVDADELKAHLTKFGELAYFDVSRAKVCLIINILVTRLNKANKSDRTLPLPNSRPSRASRRLSLPTHTRSEELRISSSRSAVLLASSTHAEELVVVVAASSDQPVKVVVVPTSTKTLLAGHSTATVAVVVA
jgi:hypothetical protein